MPVFNVSFLNPALRSGSGNSYSLLNNQLTMMENELSKDGYLSPGDYDILIEQARKLSLSGGLTSDQRSAFAAKASTYEKDKSVANINNSNNVNIMNNTLKDQEAQNVILNGNDPKTFLQVKASSLLDKINSLADSIQQSSASGKDYSSYMNEYNQTLSQYDDAVSALDAASNYDQKTSGDQPIKGYVAYVQTNNKGEIVNVKYEKYGSESGYTPVKASINGFQVYGKINYKDADKRSYFKLGNNIYTGVDMMQPDPNNPSAMISSPGMLVNQNDIPQGADNNSYIRSAQNGPYDSLSPKDLSTQSYMMNNSWAKGSNGAMYYRDNNGSYTKYINAGDNGSNLDINGPILNLPSDIEKSLMAGVGQTIDVSQPFAGNIGFQEYSAPAGPEPQAPAASPLLQENKPSPDMGGQAPLSPGGQGKNNESAQPQMEKTAKKPIAPPAGGLIQTAANTVKSASNFIGGLFK